MQISSNHGSPVPEEGQDAANTLDSLENYNSLPGVPHELEIHAVSVVPDDTFTIRQAINSFGFGKFQAKLSLFTGLCWMSDSMEVTILSILSPALYCDWNITRYQQAFATMAVFLGMMISSPIWEYLSDRFGRKKSLTLCAFLLLYYGLMSSFAPTFAWVLILRGIVGFAIGCVPQSVTMYAEYLPLKQRAKCVVLLDCFWALGACFEVVLALLVMPTLGWQWLLALSTTPVFAFACVCPWLPESVKFHVASGNSAKALELLRTVANENNKSMLLGRLVIDDATVEDNGKTRDLISPQTRTVSLLVWTIWATCSFCYYGIVLMSTELIVTSNKTYFKTKERLDVCSARCSPLNTQDYMDLLWTTFAEFPGILLTILIIDKFGHKKTMALQFFLFVLCTILLYFFIEKRAILVTLLFFARGTIAGVFQAAYLHTPEVYPSGLRSVGLSTCSLVARFGAILTPYVAQVLLHSSLMFALGVYGCTAIFAASACSCLPDVTVARQVKNPNLPNED